MRLFPFSLRGKPNPKPPANRPAAPGRAPRIYRNGHPAAPAQQEGDLRRAGLAHGTTCGRATAARWWCRASRSPPGAARRSACWGLTAPARPPVLHDHRAGGGRRRPRHARRARRDAPAHVPPRSPRHRLSAAGTIDFPWPDRRAEHHGGARAGGAQPQAAPGAAGQPAGGVRDRPQAQGPLHRAVRRRAAPLRDRPRAGHRAVIHAAGRAFRRHRPQGGRAKSRTPCAI